MTDFINYLLNYGIAGIWLIYMIYHTTWLEKQMVTTIEKNTDAVNHMSAVVEFCRKTS